MKLKRGLLLIRIVALAMLATLLIPLFIAKAESGAFYLTTVSASLIGYLLLMLLALGMKKGKLRRYLERTGNYLFLAFTLLTVAYIIFRAGWPPGGYALVALSAIGYGLFIQQLGFARWLVL